MTKLSSLSRLSRDDLQGAPEWVDTLLQSSNEFQEQATQRINQDLLVGSFTDADLVHATEKKVRNPFGRSLKGIEAIKCVGLSVDTAGKVTGGVYTLGVARLDWRHLQTRPNEPDLIGVTAYFDRTGSGDIGEQQRGFLVNSSAITLTTNVAADVTSISLTPGVWDISSVSQFFATVAATGTNLSAAINTTSATIPAASASGDYWVESPTMPTTSSGISLTIPQYRVTVSSTTTYYLVSRSTYTVGTVVSYGRLSAVRIQEYSTGLTGRVTLRFDGGN